jgi:ATP-dependent Lon protease
MEEGKNVVLVAQKSAAKDEPSPEDLYGVGTVSTILQMLKLPDGTVKVLVEGVQRARIVAVLTEKPNFEAEIDLVNVDEAGFHRDRSHAPDAAGAVRPVREAEQEDPARGAHLAVRASMAPGRLSDTIAATCRSSSSRSSRSSRCSPRASAWSSCCSSSRPRSTSCRSRSASAAA